MINRRFFPAAGFSAPRTACFTTPHGGVITPPTVGLFLIEAALLLGLVAFGVDEQMATWTVAVLVVLTAAASGEPGALPALRLVGRGLGAGAL
jgi:hypothetical protein